MTRARPEYVALAGELAFLREAFALPCTETHRADVVATLGAFECIDRYYDAEGNAEIRRVLAGDIVDILGGASRDLPRELVDRIESLRRVFAAHIAGITERLAAFVVATERARTTRAPREYLAAVEAEGRLTSEMVLLLFDDPPTRFPEFFVRLGVVGNLVDKLCDVRADYLTGEIVVEPNIVLHARLAAAFLRHAAVLVLGFPRPWQLVRWGVRYFRPLLTAWVPAPVQAASQSAVPARRAG